MLRMLEKGVVAIVISFVKLVKVSRSELRPIWTRIFTGFVQGRNAIGIPVIRTASLFPAPLRDIRSLLHEAIGEGNSSALFLHKLRR